MPPRAAAQRLTHPLPADPKIDPFVQVDRKISEWRAAHAADPPLAPPVRPARWVSVLAGVCYFLLLLIAALIVSNLLRNAPGAQPTVSIIPTPESTPSPTITILPQQSVPGPTPSPTISLSPQPGAPALPAFMTDGCLMLIKQITQGEALSLHNLRGIEFVASQVFYTALDNHCDTSPNLPRLQDTWSGALNVPDGTPIDPLVKTAVEWVLANWNLLPWQRCTYTGNADDYWVQLRNTLRFTPGLLVDIQHGTPVPNPLPQTFTFTNEPGTQVESGLGCDRGK